MGPPGSFVLRDRQRDPGSCRALVRPAPHRAYSRATLRAAKLRIPGPRYLRGVLRALQLPFVDFVSFNVYLEEQKHPGLPRPPA